MANTQDQRCDQTILVGASCCVSCARFRGLAPPWPYTCSVTKGCKHSENRSSTIGCQSILYSVAVSFSPSLGLCRCKYKRRVCPLLHKTHLISFYIRCHQPLRNRHLESQRPSLHSPHRPTMDRRERRGFRFPPGFYREGVSSSE